MIEVWDSDASHHGSCKRASLVRPSSERQATQACATADGGREEELLLEGKVTQPAITIFDTKVPMLRYLDLQGVKLDECHGVHLYSGSQVGPTMACGASQRQERPMVRIKVAL